MLVEINKDEADKKEILRALGDLGALATSTIACCVEGDAADWYEEVQLLEQQYGEAVSRAGDVLEQLMLAVELTGQLAFFELHSFSQVL